MLNRLLQKDPKTYILGRFFSHKWIQKDRVLKKENNFLEISFNQSLPNIEDMKISSQFYNFNHDSICKLSVSPKNDVSFDHADLFENSQESESDSDSYLSANEDHESMNISENFEENYFNDNTYEKSKPININRNNAIGRKEYVYVTDDMVKSYKPGNEHMFNSNVNMNNGYVLINKSPELRTLSEPNYPIKPPSFKEVLNTSLIF